MIGVVDPTLDFERSLLADGAASVIGCDEVGRGALAGPVAVGVAVMNATVAPLPDGIRDSKMLSEPRRELLAPMAITWALHSAVGLATAQEVDEIGLIASLGLAGKRALGHLHRKGVDIRRSVVILDGNSDYLNKVMRRPLNVVTRVKADRDCGSVAAASVIAKVHRDRLMIDAHAGAPDYGWDSNKGYGSTDHMDAISRVGPHELHRKSWLKMTA